MNLSEWQNIPWLERNKIKAKYKIRSSAPVKTINRGSDTFVEDDGIREGDLGPIQDYLVEDVLALRDNPVPLVDPVVPKVELPKEEKVVVKKRKPYERRKSKKAE